MTQEEIFANAKEIFYDDSLGYPSYAMCGQMPYESIVKHGYNTDEYEFYKSIETYDEESGDFRFIVADKDNLFVVKYS